MKRELTLNTFSSLLFVTQQLTGSVMAIWLKTKERSLTFAQCNSYWVFNYKKVSGGRNERMCYQSCTYGRLFNWRSSTLKNSSGFIHFLTGSVVSTCHQSHCDTAKQKSFPLKKGVLSLKDRLYRFLNSFILYIFNKL